MRVAVGRAHRPRRGETVCGDVAATVLLPAGALLCLADGLGHGELAKEAAERACNYAGENADKPLDVLFQGLDRALVGSRGAAVSIVVLQLDARRMMFAGVGNVELRAVAAARIAPPTMPGIVGQRMRRVRVWGFPLAPGDVVALTSDGVGSRFDLAALAHLGVERMASDIVEDFHKPHDDACAVVARMEID